jgi:hypothetical protein
MDTAVIFIRGLDRQSWNLMLDARNEYTRLPKTVAKLVDPPLENEVPETKQVVSTIFHSFVALLIYNSTVLGTCRVCVCGVCVCVWYLWCGVNIYVV